MFNASFFKHLELFNPKYIFIFFHFPRWQLWIESKASRNNNEKIGTGSQMRHTKKNILKLSKIENCLKSKIEIFEQSCSKRDYSPLMINVVLTEKTFEDFLLFAKTAPKSSLTH